jgi:hypothetical protein
VPLLSAVSCCISADEPEPAPVSEKQPLVILTTPRLILRDCGRRGYIDSCRIWSSATAT